MPFRQPTPSTAMRGTSRSAPASALCTVNSKSNAPPSAATPAGGVPATGHGLRSTAVPPASIFADTRLMRGTSSTQQPCRTAHSSTANAPFASVAVVMTGSAPQTAPMRRAKRFAPPRCPLSSGTAKRPHSSTATTAGSDALFPA